VRKLDPEDPTVQLAALGHNVEEFLASDVGDYLLQRAKNQEQAATESLLNLCFAGAPDAKLLEQYTMQVRVARMFQEWLGEAVETGIQALVLIKQEDVNG